MVSLPNQWNFYVHFLNDKNWDFNSYKNFNTVSTENELTGILQYMNDEKYFRQSMLFCMKDSIKPMWESVDNIKGGCYCIKVTKKNIISAWNLIVSALATKSMTPNDTIYNSLNGVSISPKRGGFCIIKIWLRDTQFKDFPSILSDDFSKSFIEYILPEDRCILFRENTEQKM